MAATFIHDKSAIEESTFAATVVFTDVDGDSVTPDSISWTLTNDAGTVINSREDVAIGSPAASVDITLQGDDLAMLTGEGRTAMRYLTVDEVYDSDLADNLPGKQYAQFELWRRDIVTARPVDLIEAKRHLAIHPSDTNHDAYLEHLIAVAISQAEAMLSRKLIQQTVTLYLDRWHDNGPYWDDRSLVLPYGQLASVTSIKYTDTDGDQTTWSSANYVVEDTQGYEPGRDTGRVVLGYGKSWPSETLYVSRPIEIIFVCGYGSSSATIPDDIRHGIMIMIDDMFQNRENNLVGIGANFVRLNTIENLFQGYRMWRFLL